MRKSGNYFILGSALLICASQNATAACMCQCVSGRVEAICQSAIDLKPICSPALCPLVPPSLKPIETPAVPPVGTSQCHNKQVWNQNTERYEWVRLCN